MKYIALSQGEIAIVDDEDYEELNQHKWCIRTGYAIRWQKGKKPPRRIDMHRHILKAPPNLLVDHINGNKSDNRKFNLRLATHSQNHANQMKRRRATSEYKGVCWKKRERKWSAQAAYLGKSYHLGHFNSEREAALAYNQKASSLFGEFAKLNDV